MLSRERRLRTLGLVLLLSCISDSDQFSSNLLGSLAGDGNWCFLTAVITSPYTSTLPFINPRTTQPQYNTECLFSFKSSCTTLQSSWKIRISRIQFLPYFNSMVEDLLEQFHNFLVSQSQDQWPCDAAIQWKQHPTKASHTWALNSK